MTLLSPQGKTREAEKQGSRERERDRMTTGNWTSVADGKRDSAET